MAISVENQLPYEAGLLPRLSRVQIFLNQQHSHLISGGKPNAIYPTSSRTQRGYTRGLIQPYIKTYREFGSSQGRARTGNTHDVSSALLGYCDWTVVGHDGNAWFKGCRVLSCCIGNGNIPELQNQPSQIFCNKSGTQLPRKISWPKNFFLKINEMLCQK